jgi:glycosyltransferase involved in cell wall biosynthesis
MLSLLNHQDGIEDVHVVVADISDDGITKEKLKRRKGDKFKLRIVQGGLPGVGRNNGSKVVTTPYILFMDSDIFILDTKLITESLDVMIRDGFY